MLCVNGQRINFGGFFSQPSGENIFSNNAPKRKIVSVIIVYMLPETSLAKKGSHLFSNTSAFGFQDFPSPPTCLDLLRPAANRL